MKNASQQPRKEHVTKKLAKTTCRPLTSALQEKPDKVYVERLVVLEEGERAESNSGKTQLVKTKPQQTRWATTVTNHLACLTQLVPSARAAGKAQVLARSVPKMGPTVVPFFADPQPARCMHPRTQRGLPQADENVLMRKRT